jgi:hypothetical protein
MTWEQTERELERLRSTFIHLHNIGEKNLDEKQKMLLLDCRKYCIILGEIRYELVRKGEA